MSAIISGFTSTAFDISRCEVRGSQENITPEALALAVHLLGELTAAVVIAELELLRRTCTESQKTLLRSRVRKRAASWVVCAGRR